MTFWISLALLVVLSVPIWLGLRRGAELFAIDVVEGRPRLRRGRIPPALMDEIADIVRRNRVAAGRIRVESEGGSPRVIAPASFPDGAVQQLRNVVGQYPVARLRTGRLRR
jgi:hypothetical protein